MTAKADRARQLMEHPEIQDAFQNLRKFYIDHLVDQVPSAEDNFDAAVLMDLKRMLHLTGQLRKDLEKMIEVGMTVSGGDTSKLQDLPGMVGGC